MSVLDALVARGATQNPFGVAELASEPPKDDPIASFRAMHTAVAEMPLGEGGSGCIAPCQTPWLEVTLTDAEDAPLAQAPCVLAVPGAGERRATLDAQGYARFEDVDLGPGPWVLEITVDHDDEGEPVLYRLALVRTANAAAPQAELEEAEADEREDFEVDYFRA